MTRSRVVLRTALVAMACVTTWAAVVVVTSGVRPLSVAALLVLCASFAVTLGRGPLRTARSVIAGALSFLGVVLHLASLHGALRTTDAWAIDVVACVALLMIWRDRHVVAWVTMLVPTAIVWVACGFEQVQNIGVLATVLVVAVIAAAARVLAWYTGRMTEYAESEQEALDSRIARDAYQVGHQQRIERTGRLAGAMLQRIIDADGRLDPADRLECRLLHQSIRDETRGRHLLSEPVRQQVLAHRRRGAAVQLLDDGDLAEADPRALKQALEEIADALSALTSDRIVIRSTTAADCDVITVVATSSDPIAAALGQDDEDEVDLLLERRLPRLLAEARTRA